MVSVGQLYEVCDAYALQCINGESSVDWGI